jgi:chromosome segregation ATPase
MKRIETNKHSALKHLERQCERLRTYESIKNIKRQAEIQLEAAKALNLINSIESLDKDISEIGEYAAQKGTAKLERIRMKRSEYSHMKEQHFVKIKELGAEPLIELDRLPSEFDTDSAKQILDNCRSDLLALGAVNTMACEDLDRLKSETESN